MHLDFFYRESDSQLGAENINFQFCASSRHFDLFDLLHSWDCLPVITQEFLIIGIFYISNNLMSLDLPISLCAPKA